MIMDTRSRQRLPVEAVSVDLKKVEKTFKRYCRSAVTPLEREVAQENGLTPLDVKFKEFMHVTAMESEKAREKGITSLQWKLREIYREIFEQEFAIFRDEQHSKGVYVSYSGLTLKERMDKFPDIAETAFMNWAKHLGLAHLYGVGKDPDRLVGRVFSDSSGLTVYERFHELLCTLF